MERGGRVSYGMQNLRESYQYLGSLGLIHVNQLPIAAVVVKAMDSHPQTPVNIHRRHQELEEHPAMVTAVLQKKCYIIHVDGSKP